MATAKKKERIPGFSVGVRANAAARMVKMARPICPNSKIKMIKGEDGKWVPAEDQPQNCQLLDMEPGVHWTEVCTSLGHNPFWTERVWYEKQDVVEVDEETGDEIVTGTKRIRHITKRPNVAQVAAHIRVNSGQGVVHAMRNKGYKRLSEVGFEEVCQFRNCQKPLAAKFSGTNYGSYCSREHLALIAADAEGIMLHYPILELNAAEYDKVKKARERQLREALASVE